MVHRVFFSANCTFVLTLLICFVRPCAQASEGGPGGEGGVLHRGQALSRRGVIDAAHYYYEHWCGGELQYLDDALCAKAFPSNTSRHATCPVQYESVQAGDGYGPDPPSLSAVRVHSSAALEAIPHVGDTNIALVLVRRAVNGSVFYKYIGNGREREPHETWSSSKIFAVANAAGALRRECVEEVVSLADAFTKGKHGATALSDLVTIVCSYDTTMGYTSNSLAKYFSTAGGQKALDALIQVWLQQNGTGQSLGGSYGEQPPPDLPYAFAARTGGSGVGARHWWTQERGALGGAEKAGAEKAGAEKAGAEKAGDERQGKSKGDAGGGVCAVDADPSAPYAANTLSALTMAEMVRRLVLFRSVCAASRFPNTTWEDTQQVLYGAQHSLFFRGEQWGGMSADPAIFMQSGVDIAAIDAQSNGLWRIFSKLGAGYSSSRARGEIINNGYACLPSSGSTPGAEFVLSARTSVPLDTTLVAAQALMHEVVANVVQLVFEGKIA